MKGSKQESHLQDLFSAASFIKMFGNMSMHFFSPQFEFPAGSRSLTLSLALLLACPGGRPL
jgi:hypothetical protein